MSHIPRQYIRHPSECPIGLRVSDKKSISPLINISEGGVCLHHEEAISHGTGVTVSYPHEAITFEAQGIVIWCCQAEHGYDIGVQFTSTEDKFGVRMMEQVSHIEHYRREVEKREGRRLTIDQAASEWIEQHSSQFPPI